MRFQSRSRDSASRKHFVPDQMKDDERVSVPIAGFSKSKGDGRRASSEGLIGFSPDRGIQQVERVFEVEGQTLIEAFQSRSRDSASRKTIVV